MYFKLHDSRDVSSVNTIHMHIPPHDFKETTRTQLNNERYFKETTRTEMNNAKYCIHLKISPQQNFTLQANARVGRFRIHIENVTSVLRKM